MKHLGNWYIEDKEANKLADFLGLNKIYNPEENNNWKEYVAQYQPRSNVAPQFIISQEDIGYLKNVASVDDDLFKLENELRQKLEKLQEHRAGLNESALNRIIFKDNELEDVLFKKLHQMVRNNINCVINKLSNKVEISLKFVAQNKDKLLERYKNEIIQSLKIDDNEIYTHVELSPDQYNDCIGKCYDGFFSLRLQYRDALIDKAVCTEMHESEEEKTYRP
ncbi:MAG: hypothetical protein H0W64_05190 [Gammaproteobacteria bacterium]|nr:hypothetical protein [Gammaproteobacteria bacterium]